MAKKGGIAGHRVPTARGTPSTPYTRLLHRHHVQFQCRRPHQPLLVAEMLPSQRLSRQVPQPLHEGDVATVEAFEAPRKWLRKAGLGGKMVFQRDVCPFGFLESACIDMKGFRFNSPDASQWLVGDFSEAAAAGRLVLPSTLFSMTMLTCRPSLQPTHPDSSTAVSWVQPTVREAGREGDTRRRSAPAKRDDANVWTAWAQFRAAGKAA